MLTPKGQAILDAMQRWQDRTDEPALTHTHAHTSSFSLDTVVFLELSIDMLTIFAKSRGEFDAFKPTIDELTATYNDLSADIVEH